MRRLSVNSLVTGFAVAICFSPALLGSTLYQWTGKDGTPTYSPDPPPAGVEYQLVGADLKPLAKNIDLARPAGTDAATSPGRGTAVAPVPAPAPAATATNAATAPKVLAAPAPVKKPAAPWKPVRYANDPKPKVSAAVSDVVKPDPIALARRSPECNRAKQKMVLLESQFSRAITDEQMDNAVLQLREQKIALKSACKLP